MRYREFARTKAVSPACTLCVPGMVTASALRQRDNIVAGWCAGVEHSAPRQHVGMVGDILAVVAFDHGDGSVMFGRDDANRHIGEQIAHDRTMPQRIERYFAGDRALCAEPPAGIVLSGLIASIVHRSALSIAALR